MSPTADRDTWPGKVVQLYNEVKAAWGVNYDVPFILGELPAGGCCSGRYNTQVHAAAGPAAGRLLDLSAGHGRDGSVPLRSCVRRSHGNALRREDDSRLVKGFSSSRTRAEAKALVREPGSRSRLRARFSRRIGPSATAAPTGPSPKSIELGEPASHETLPSPSVATASASCAPGPPSC